MALEGTAAVSAFWILAVVSVVTALAVVMLKDIFRAALFLVLCFFTVAGIYATLSADFLAVVQVLVYVGAIGILLIFAIMVTKETQHGSLFNRQHVFAMFFAVLLLIAMIGSVTQTDWDRLRDVANPSTEATHTEALESGEGLTDEIGARLFDEDGFILPVEIAGVMLLAAVLGGIVIMRERDKE
ncbi:NADH-quinone oxidoreductase subunit J [Chloroflexota bacterium]